MSSRSYDRSTAELEADLRQLRRDLTEAERQRDAATREADHRQREAEQLRAHASTAELEADLRQLRRDLTEAERQRDAATREADHRQREAEQLRAHAAAQAQHLAEARAQIEDLRRALERADAVHAKKVTLAEGVGELAALVLTNHIARAFQAVGPERCEELRTLGVVPGFVLHVEYKAYRLRDLPAPDAAARRRYVDAYWHYRRSGTTPIAVIVSFPDGARGTSILGWGTRSENAPPELTTPTQEPPAQEASP